MAAPAARREHERMAATIFKGSISFGLVSVPIRLYSATEEKQVSLHTVHTADNGRVRYRKVCEIDGAELAPSDISRAYEAPDGRVAILSAEDMKHLPLPSKSVIEVLSFTQVDQIDPVMIGRSYLVEADPKSPGKPYVLLREAMGDSGKAAVVRVALRGREHLALLRPDGEVLVLQLLMWPDEVRDPQAIHVPDDEVRAQERKMAMSLIDSMSADFEPDQYEDHYRQALTELVEAKLEGAPLPAEAPSEPGGQVVDLMDALRASVRKAKDEGAGARKAPARKAAGSAGSSGSAKKTAAGRKSAAKATAKSNAAKAGSGKAATGKAPRKAAGTAKKAAPAKPRRAS